MEIWVLAVFGAMAVLIAALILKIHLLRKSAGEISRAFEDRLSRDTNTLIDISSRDRRMRSLADDINRQLRLLRQERQRCQQGDAELKAAVTNISHDLRTPLTAICGYLDLLAREDCSDESDEARRYLDIIRGRADSLRELTEELFRYSVIVSEEKEPELEAVSLNAALEESIASAYASLSAAGIDPCIHIPEETIMKKLDKSLLSRIFGNILSNAAKYSDGDLSVALSPEGIRFQNTASRLDKLQAERLFDRFYTVESARSSTGLGLSIAKELTEKMGGSISAEYEKSSLTVILRFP